MDITELSAAELSEAIHGGEVSCREVMAAYLDRIDEQNPAVNAIVSLRDRDELLAEAADVRRRAGPRPVPRLDARHAASHQGPRRDQGAAHDEGLAAARALRSRLRLPDGRADEGRPAASSSARPTCPSSGSARTRSTTCSAPRATRSTSTRTAGGSSGGAAVGPGHAHAAGRRRQRLHGLAAQPGGVEQRVRVPPEPGPRAQLAGARHLPRPARHRGPDGSHRARRCHAARHAGRLRRRGRRCRCRAASTSSRR